MVILLLVTESVESTALPYPILSYLIQDFEPMLNVRWRLSWKDTCTSEQRIWWHRDMQIGCPVFVNRQGAVVGNVPIGLPIVVHLLGCLRSKSADSFLCMLLL